jgi:cytochrome c biogenesis protein CcdA
MGFGARTDSKLTGTYFILGRVIGVILLGMIIASIGFILEGYTIYLVLIFGVLTIIFGLLVIFNKKLTWKSISPFKSHLKPTAMDGGTCIGPKKGHGKCKNNHKGHHPQKGRIFNNKYAFSLGLFRGATPCLKIMVLTPLLLVVELQLALLMMLGYVATSTIYPIIGHLTANLVTKFDKYDLYIRVTGAVVLIILGIYSISKILFFDAGTHFGV